MQVFIPIISAGLDIIGSLLNSFNTREEQRLQIIAYEKQARLEMEKIQLEATIDKQAKEQSLAILKGILEIIKDLVKTDVELKLLVGRVEADRQMQIGDWVIAKKREICELNNQQVKYLQDFLLRAKDLDELDRDKFKYLVYENFEQNKKSIHDNNEWLVKQVENLVTKGGVELISLKEEFQQFLNMDTVKLLQHYSQ